MSKHYQYKNLPYELNFCIFDRMPLSVRQSTELFHLVFLRALVAKGEDKSLVALKGGCNLRFFFGSVRYSEDMDLDVVVIAKETLKRKVARLLVSPVVTAPLKTHGLTIVETSTPKQTDTTQRWKFGLRKKWLSAAIDHAMGLSFDEYTAKVIAFLEPSHAELYSERSTWNAMQEDVVLRLEALR